MRNQTVNLLLCLVLGLSVAAAPKPEERVRHLGPTGIFGTINGKAITVSKIDKGSPADGKLQPGEVIVAAGGAEFKDDPRKAFANAIDQAETEAGRGVLTLTVENPTKENSLRTVDLQLAVLGSYDATDPLASAKATAIVTRAADQLVKSGKYGDLDIGLLALLSTGEKKYIDQVGVVLHKTPWAMPDINLSPALENGEGGFVAWSWGYQTITLCEYYLLTGDKYVLPAIEKYAIAIAQGQDAAGLWGHRMAYYSLNGGAHHGRLPGYAVMNQSSLPLFISLILADKCGVKDPEITRAIAQTGAFYRNFVDKGALPYGNHAPFDNVINDNGKSGLAAVALSLTGDTEGAKFFAALSAASHTGLETGHTGHYFNQLWTGLGANVAGPEVSSAFFTESRWLHTLNRRWDNTFTYDDEKGGNFSYRGLNASAIHIINYCRNRRALFITGKNANQSIWLTGEGAKNAVAAGYTDLKTLPDEQLITLLGDSLPWRRTRASAALKERGKDYNELIRKLLQAGTWQQKVGACQLIAAMAPSTAPLADDLVKLITDKKEGVVVRQEAVDALCAQGELAKPYFNVLLPVILEDNPNDPLHDLPRTLGMDMAKAFTPDPHALGLVTDTPLFYSAMNALLNHKHEWARGAAMSLLKDIPPEDFRYVADSFMHVMRNKDLTYVSYHNPTSTVGTGAATLARLNVGEGMDCLVDCLSADSGKWGFKFRMFMNVLPKYGANAKPVLEKLATDPKFTALFEKGDNEKWNAMVKAIENAPPGPKLITAEEAKLLGPSSTQPSH